MEKLSVIDLAKKIEAENQAFEKMTNAQKRVVIAQDCLTRIELEQIVPKANRFCKIFSDYEHSELNIKDVLNTATTPICDACAKGSLFMSYIGRVNQLSFDDIMEDNSINDNDHKKLMEIFTRKQLALIEYVFENAQYIHYDSKGNDLEFDHGKIIKFRNKFMGDGNTDSNLLKAICENIIKNRGTFKL